MAGAFAWVGAVGSSLDRNGSVEVHGSDAVDLVTVSDPFRIEVSVLLSLKQKP